MAVQEALPSIISIETTDENLVHRFRRIGQERIDWMERRWVVGQIITTGSVTRLHRIELVEIIEERR